MMRIQATTPRTSPVFSSPFAPAAWPEMAETLTFLSGPSPAQAIARANRDSRHIGLPALDAAWQYWQDRQRL